MTKGARRTLLTIFLIALAGGLVAFGTYLFRQGLDDADKVASVVGVFLNVLALLCAIAGVWLGWAAGQGGRPAVTADDRVDALLKHLADEVRRELIGEEAIRRVHDPFPLAIGLERAEEWLHDHEENIVGGPGVRLPPLNGSLATIVERYKSIPSGRLVVLGRAGAGKSVLAMRLVLGLLEAREGPDGPVPVLVPMSSWDPSKLSLYGWLSSYLLATYPFLQPLSAGEDRGCTALLEDGRILPVLDGFDEVGEADRAPALKLLNFAFAPGRRLVVTSRIDEYVEAVERGDVLTGSAVLRIKDLDEREVSRYLPLTARKPTRHDTHEKWHTVLDRLRADATSPLRETLSTPLMVSMARAAYSDTDADPVELLDQGAFPDSASIQRHLLDSFVTAVYDQPPRPGTSRPEDPARALRFVASQVYDLYSDAINWWAFASAVPRVAAAALWGAAGAAIGLTLAMLRDGLVVGLSGPFLMAYGLAVGGLIGVMIGSFRPAHAPRRIPPTVGAALRGALRNARTVVPLATAMAVTVRLVVEWMSGDVITVSSAVDAAWAGLGFSALLSVGFALDQAPSHDARTASPRSVLAADRRTSLVLMMITAAGVSVFDLVVLGFGAVDAVLVGLAATLLAGSQYAWPHFVVARMWFLLSGRFPWRTVRFLEDAHLRGVFRQLAGSYQFRHALLRDRLVAQSVQERTAPRWAQVIRATGRRPWRCWLTIATLHLARALGWHSKTYVYSELSHAWFELGRYRKAVRYAEAASLSREGDFRTVSIHRFNLGEAYEVAGRLDDAYTTLRSVMQDRWDRIGPSDPHTLNSRKSLGILLLEWGRPAEAEPIVDGLVENYARLLGPDDRQTLHARYAVGLLRVCRGDAGAEPYLRELLADLESAARPVPDVLTAVQATLAACCARTGRLREADEQLTAAIDIARGMRGSAHPATLGGRLMRLRIRHELGAPPARGAREAQRIARRLSKRLGADHPEVRAASALADHLLAQAGAGRRAASADHPSRRPPDPEPPHTCSAVCQHGAAHPEDDVAAYG